METLNYTIRIAVSNDLPQVLHLMRNNFYFEENMLKALCLESNITDSERKLITEISDESVRTIFNGSVCLVAVDDSDKIIGANLTLLSENPSFGGGKDPLAEIFHSDGPKSKLIEEYHKFLMDINSRADLFKRYPNVQTMMEFYAIAVDEDHGRKGIARELILAGIAWAKEHDILLVFGVFSSMWSTKSAQKAGMKIVLEVDLLEYKDRDDKRVFESTVPHNVVNVMICEI